VGYGQKEKVLKVLTFRTLLWFATCVCGMDGTNRRHPNALYSNNYHSQKIISTACSTSKQIDWLSI